jgi:hypothetical protein
VNLHRHFALIAKILICVELIINDATPLLLLLLLLLFAVRSNPRVLVVHLVRSDLLRPFGLPIRPLKYDGKTKHMVDDQREHY